VADLEIEVEEGHEDKLDHFGEMGQGFDRGDDLAVVKEHDIQIAFRIQFPASITAEGDQGQRGKFPLSLGGEAVFGAVPELAQQHIDHCGVTPANLVSPCPSLMKELQAVGFHLEKVPKGSQVKWRGSVFGLRQLGVGAGLDFL
jgi:hypothetical protein